MLESLLSIVQRNAGAGRVGLLYFLLLLCDAGAMGPWYGTAVFSKTTTYSGVTYVETWTAVANGTTLTLSIEQSPSGPVDWLVNTRGMQGTYNFYTNHTYGTYPNGLYFTWTGVDNGRWVFSDHGATSWGPFIGALSETAPTPTPTPTPTPVPYNLVGNIRVRAFGPTGGTVPVVIWGPGGAPLRETTAATFPDPAESGEVINFTYTGDSIAGVTIYAEVAGSVVASGIAPADPGGTMELGIVTVNAPESMTGHVDLSGNVSSAKINFYDESGNFVGSADVDASGNWNFPLSEGLYGKSLTGKLSTVTIVDGQAYPSETGVGLYVVGSGTTAVGSSDANVGVVNIGGGGSSSSSGGSSTVGAVTSTVSTGSNSTTQTTYSYQTGSGAMNSVSYAGTGTGGASSADIREQTAQLSAKLDEVRETVGDSGNNSDYEFPSIDQGSEVTPDTEGLSSNAAKVQSILSNLGEIKTAFGSVFEALTLQLPTSFGQNPILSYDFPQPIGTLTVDLSQTPHLDMIRAAFAILFIILAFFGAIKIVRGSFVDAS